MSQDKLSSRSHQPVQPGFPPRRAGVRQSQHWRDILVLGLALVAGYVDAISYLGLHQVFTANMTGNMVLLGIAAGQGQVLASLRSLVALTGFGLGVAVAALIVERDSRRLLWPPAVTAALVFEMAALVGLALGWRQAGTPDGYMLQMLILLSALAMGIQSAAVRRLGISGVATTYVTGVLLTVIVGLTGRPGIIASSPPGRRSPPTLSLLQAVREIRLPAAVLGVYGSGAVIGGILAPHWHGDAVWFAVVMIITVIAGAAAGHLSGRTSE